MPDTFDPGHRRDAGRVFLLRALMTVVMLSPLPLGSNRPWAWDTLALLVAVLLGLHGLVTALVEDRHHFAPSRFAPGLALYGSVLVWIVLQAVPVLPESWASELWPAAAAAISKPLPATISIDPGATVSALLRLLTYGGVFWLAANLCRSSRAAQSALVCVAVGVTAYSLYGIAMHFAGVEAILWFPKESYLGDVTATFINRNSFASFAGIGFLCAIGWLFLLVEDKLHGSGIAREELREFVKVMLERAWFPLCAIIVSFTALTLSHSRAGLLSTLGGTIALLATVYAARIVPRAPMGWLAGVVTAFGLLAFVVSGDGVVKRLTEEGADSRIWAYGQQLKAIQDHPLSGTGFGTFERAFLAYRDAAHQETWDKGHSTYLENAVELGIPAALTLFASVAWIGGVCLYGVVTRHSHRIFPAVGLGATILVALHSSVDFSLQIPAVTVTWCLVAGIGWAQSWPRRRRGRSEAPGRRISTS